MMSLGSIQRRVRFRKQEKRWQGKNSMSTFVSMTRLISDRWENGLTQLSIPACFMFSTMVIERNTSSQWQVYLQREGVFTFFVSVIVSLDLGDHEEFKSRCFIRRSKTIGGSRR